MPNIKPISDLRNYNEVLRDISAGEPVFLTKNGRGLERIIRYLYEILFIRMPQLFAFYKLRTNHTSHE